MEMGHRHTVRQRQHVISRFRLFGCNTRTARNCNWPTEGLHSGESANVCAEVPHRWNMQLRRSSKCSTHDKFLQHSIHTPTLLDSEATCSCAAAMRSAAAAASASLAKPWQPTFWPSSCVSVACVVNTGCDWKESAVLYLTEECFVASGLQTAKKGKKKHWVSAPAGKDCAGTCHVGGLPSSTHLEACARGRLQRGAHRPILLRHKGLDLRFALGNKPQRHRLHTACRT